MIRVAGALLLVAMLPSSALAECAWVLWGGERRPTKGGVLEEAWTAVGGFRNFADCEAKRVDITKALKMYRDAMAAENKKMGVTPETVDASYVTCFPDTIDPRGPKGAGR